MGSQTYAPLDEYHSLNTPTEGGGYDRAPKFKTMVEGEDHGRFWITKSRSEQSADLAATDAAANVATKSSLDRQFYRVCIGRPCWPDGDRERWRLCRCRGGLCSRWLDKAPFV